MDGFAAYLLPECGRHVEAAHHAETAFQQFPIRFFRYLHGAILAAQGHEEQAWTVLLPLATWKNVQSIRTRATLAARVAPDEAVPLFTRYLEAAPDDHAIRLAFANFEQLAGRWHHAADVTWSIFESSQKSQLRADILFSIGQSQFAGPSPHQEAHPRVLAIADELTRRFVGDERASRMRQTLLRHFDQPVPTEVPTLAVVQDVMVEGLPTTRALSESYERIGVPSFARLSVELALAPAALLVHLSRRTDHRVLPALSLAIDTRMMPSPSLHGLRVLIGPLELALFEALDVWTVLPSALGPDGRLIVFESVAEALTRAGDAAAEDSADKALATAVARARQSGLLQTIAFDSSTAPTSDAIRRDALTTNYRLSLHLELAYYETVVSHPGLYLLCADALTASPHGVLGKATAWIDRADENENASFAERLNFLQSRVLFLQAFLRSVYAQHEADRVNKMEQLAGLGFADALGGRELLALSRRHGGVDKEEPARILNRAERLARRPQHYAQHDACTTLAFTYAQAIWEATCGDDAWAETEARALTSGLLGRADDLDRTAHAGILERLFQNIGQWAVSFPMASGFVAVGMPPRLSEHSPAARLWQFINAWAGAVGHRQAAVDRGLSRVWLKLDELTGGVGPSKEMAAPLLLGTFGTLNFAARSTFGAFDVAMILSAHWTEKPFEECAVMLGATKSNEQRQVNINDLFPLIMNQVERGLYFLTEATCRTHIVVPQAGSVAYATRPEVALLRLEGRQFVDFARELAAKQGLHDGRAHERLIRLCEQPADMGLRRNVARDAVLLPFILFRNDATTLLQWAYVHVPGYPHTLEDLCAMLSESVESPSADKLLSEHLADRIQEGGLWAQREEGGPLFSQATQVPGDVSIGVFDLNWPDNPADFGRLVAGLLTVLEWPNEHPAGHIGQAIFALRVIGEHNQHVSLPQGDVDLRERLPERLVNLLDAVQTPPQEGTLAAYEAGLLRFCSAQVTRLDHESRLSPRHHLWLTQRLFQWIIAQLDTLTPAAKLAAFDVLGRDLPKAAVEQASDDLLDPAGFDRDHGIDYRLVTILYALSQMNAVAKEDQEEEQEAPAVKPWRFSSSMLEERFAKLAARPFTKRELRVRVHGQTPTSFDWDAPGALPDLALLALITSRREGFARIAPDARLRWIRDLPASPTDTTRTPWVVARALYQAVNAALPRLGVDEAQAYEENLRELNGSAEALRWRWLGLTALFRAGRGNVTEEEALTLLLGQLAAKAAPKVFGWALLGVARKNVEHLETFVQRVMDTALERKLDPVPLAEGITFVIAFGKARAAIVKAREIILALYAKPPFQGDARMNALVAQFGMS